MSNFDFNYTLFTSQQNGSSPYDLQIAATFDTNQYIPGAATVVTPPQSEDDTLHVKLELLAGSDGTVIHDFELGIIPSYTPKWIIDVEYVDTQGNPVKRKKKNTEQAEIEAQPRPYK